MNIAELLNFTVLHNGSDLHIAPELPPMVRIDGDLKRIDAPPLDAKTVHNLLYDIMTDQQRKHFEENLEVDFSFELPKVARFRANVFNHNSGVGGAFRTIPRCISTLEELGFPDTFKELCTRPRGLVIVTGPTGSGKSTTLAAMVDYINSNFHKHIITIEDPIEFLHDSKKCLINQREVFRDTRGFKHALKAALREDPDIIQVGEMRDIETIRLALTAAETGHLVFATLHTISAAKTINRIIDVFPAGEKEMVRSMLSSSLEAVISQTLLRKIESGRIAAFEIMICNAAIRNLIREDKIPQIYSAIQTGAGLGMLTLDQHLKELIKQNHIAPGVAQQVAVNKELFI